MTNFEWLMTLSEEEFTNWVYDQWLHHLQYKWSSSRGGLMIWLKEERAEQTEPQTYVINPQEPTNDDKCFECDDFFTCDGQCDEVEDEPQTENPCDGCVCDDGKHLMYCMNCKGIAWKTEPPKVEDEPQTDCYVSDLCKHYGDKQICGRCRSRNLFCEAEPQPRCPKCGKRGYIRSLESMGVKLKVFDEYKWKCTNCNKYFKEEPKDEPQTERSK